MDKKTERNELISRVLGHSQSTPLLAGAHLLKDSERARIAGLTEKLKRVSKF